MNVSKTDVRFLPDPRRVIVKPFVPGGEISPDGRCHVQRIIERILALPEAVVVSTLTSAERRYAERHRDLSAAFEANFARVEHHLDDKGELSAERRRLIGAYFTHEYALEAAALANPSIVAAPDQSGLAPGEQRFVISLRAIGEGHISSIEFRSGVIDAEGHVAIDDASPFVTTGKRRAPLYEKRAFRHKLNELGTLSQTVVKVLDALSDRFELAELEAVLRDVDLERGSQPGNTQATRTIHWLASSNYETSFSPETQISERALFPAAPTESRGMEDARFVRFEDDDGSVTYFGTYTAFDGYQILPQLIETRDFLSFRIATLNGASARNKGIAVFPRKIGGHYAALARVDNEQNYLMMTDDVRFWHDCTPIQIPKYPWELTQIGNCGSPLETEAGWLVITHGVGALREYSLGAILLDLDDPARVIGHLQEPLLAPTADEREGYVPNVVYSCGSMISGKMLVLPYGFADVGTRIATLPVADLLAALIRV